MNAFRLLADDLTGALDTTAELVPLAGAVPVFWPRVMPAAPEGSAAFDSATRECAPEDAAAETARLCRHLQGAALAFKKIDSLIRGATLHEVAACMRTGAWPCAILAPAFPFQHRITRGGQQLVQINGPWTPTGPHLVSALAKLGVRAHLAHDDLTPGVNVFDAESDNALRTVAALGRRHPGPVLWIGTGGLAQALAADHPPPVPALPQPVLGLFGSDQPATLDQLAACAEHWLELDAEAHDPMIHGPVIERVQATGLALVSFRLPAGLGRAAAAQGIAARIARLADSIDPPGTVVVAGGETLRSLCDAVGADSLLVTGRLLPGVPCSVIQGGRWNGVTVVSKSGAFGPPDLLRRLLLAERRTS